MADDSRREVEEHFGGVMRRGPRAPAVTWIEWALIAMVAFAFLALGVMARQIGALQGQVRDLQGLLAVAKEQATEAADRAQLNGDRLCELIGRTVQANDVGTLRRLRCVRDSTR